MHRLCLAYAAPLHHRRGVCPLPFPFLDCMLEHVPNFHMLDWSLLGEDYD